MIMMIMMKNEKKVKVKVVSGKLFSESESYISMKQNLAFLPSNWKCCLLKKSSVFPCWDIAAIIAVANVEQYKEQIQAIIMLKKIIDHNGVQDFVQTCENNSSGGLGCGTL